MINLCSEQIVHTSRAVQLLMQKNFVKDYFSFTKKERSAIMILLAIIIAILLVKFVAPHFIEEEVVDHSQFEKEIAQLQFDSSKQKHEYKTKDYNDYSDINEDLATESQLFNFDPNTASEKDWIALGVREKTARTIVKYVSKGGKFYKPQDIKKIWGLRQTDVERLLPYVRIQKISKEFPANEPKEPRDDFTKNVSYNNRRRIETVDVNMADTAAFIALPGIGSKLSQRIIAFREKLGGFYSVDQVGETYFLADSTFQRIKPFLVLGNNPIKQFDVNKATVDEMKSHPYIKYNVANAIVQYRNQHGNYSSVESIKKIMIITEEMYNKIAPYLTIE